MSKYIPLTLNLIEEGRFLDAANDELKKLARLMVAYRDRYGAELSQKARAKLTLTITLGRSELGEDAFGVVTDLKTTTPGRPSMKTLAICGNAADEGLFVRPSGSSGTEPRQGVFTTEDGRSVDPETGEVVNDKSDKAEAEATDD